MALVSAPLADFDSEEWNEFHDFGEPPKSEEIECHRRTGVPDECDAPQRRGVLKVQRVRICDKEGEGPDEDCLKTRPDDSLGEVTREEDVDVDGFGETTSTDDLLSGSLEDLVNTFDDKVTKCFHDYAEHVEKIAPVQVRSEAEVGMRESQSWWTLTGDYGNHLPINWIGGGVGGRCYRRSENDSPAAGTDDDDDEDDEENSEEKEEDELYFTNDDLCMDVDEPLAEDVISELEALMEEEGSLSGRSSIAHESTDSVSPDNAAYSRSPSAWFGDTLKRLTASALARLTLELEEEIKHYQLVCTQEQRLNEQLRYNKQLNDEFIDRMMNIQSKLSPHPPTGHHHRHGDRSRTQRLTTNRYLTTIVPYKRSEAPPTVEELQIYIKILSAIDEDSASVPGLLTDYILKASGQSGGGGLFAVPQKRTIDIGQRV